MNKKLTSILLSALLLVTSCIPAFAADESFQTLSGNSVSGNTLVTANTGDESSLQGAYQVQIPATIQLKIASDFMYRSKYIVRAKGNIPVSKQLSITPDAEFKMTLESDSSKEDTATTNQPKQIWTREGTNDTLKLEKNNWTESKGSVEADLQYEGSYKGNLHFNYKLSPIGTSVGTTYTPVTFKLGESPADFSQITQIRTYAPDGTLKHTYNNLSTNTVYTAYVDGKVVLSHDNSRTWYYGSPIGSEEEVGSGEYCHFIVPSNASEYTEQALLYIYKDANGQATDKIDAYDSTEWFYDITLELGE